MAENGENLISAQSRISAQPKSPEIEKCAQGAYLNNYGIKSDKAAVHVQSGFEKYRERGEGRVRGGGGE